MVRSWKMMRFYRCQMFLMEFRWMMRSEGSTDLSYYNKGSFTHSYYLATSPERNLLLRP